MDGTEDVIITRIIGGLGNQMFQYAVGRRLALATDQALKLDLTAMEAYRLRAFALQQFDINAEIAKANEIPPKPRRGLRGRFERWLGRDRGRGARVVERGFPFNSGILDIRGPAYLSGYWQSEKYFADVAAIIRADFALKQPMQPARAHTLAQIHAHQAVSVHVRRGDYVSNPAANAFHGTCEPDWYAAAMARMTERFGAVTFFVFSDDPAWAQANLASSRPMVFVAPQDDGRDGEDMHLMAACRGHIIANSSFSWWGAWLNPATDKRVIAPRQWFRDPNQDTRDLVPADWERL